MSEHRPTPGFAIGPFDLFERLGRGGMGEVWRAVHRATGTAAAVKVVTTAYADNAAFRASFQREVRAMARLDHPAIVRVFDYGHIDADVAKASDGGFVEASPYVALELAEDGSLFDFMQRGYTWADVRQILMSVLDALAHSHARGLLHRDIKPDNVLAGRRGGQRQWKLTDFGIAHAIDAIDAERPHELTGTPFYMAPEQFSSTWRDFGPHTDLYALGCMAFQLVAGQVPFSASSAIEVAHKHLNQTPPPLEPKVAVPVGFEAWIDRLLQKDAGARFQKAADAARALAALTGEPSPALCTIATRTDTAALAWDMPTLPTPPPRTRIEPTLASSQALARELSASQPKPVSRADGAERDVAWRERRIEVPEDWRPRVAKEPHSLIGVSPRLYGLRAIPMVGRETQRDVLWESLAGVADEKRPRLVVLQGPSGCGKSRLARWLCERADETGAASYLRATHGPERVSGDGLAGLLTRWANLGGLDEAGVRARLEAGLNVTDDPNYQWMVDDLTALVCAVDADQSTLTNPMQALLELFRRLAHRRPVVVWLDDLQWAESAIGLLEHVGEFAKYDAPILICATVQSEALAERPIVSERLDRLRDADWAHHIQLGPLTPGENRALIDELLQLDEELSQRIAHRVAGNPLFAVQLVGDWVERGWLVAQERGFCLSDGVTAQLPDSLHSVWTERIQRALAHQPVDDTRAVYLAALLGRDVDAAEWEAACRRAGIEARASLVDQLVELKLAESTDSGWAFIHGMLRESLLRQAQEDEGWRELNATTAAALESMAQRSGTPELAARIGRLLMGAGVERRAIPFLLQGARHLQTQAVQAAALETVDLLERACDTVGDAALETRLEGQLVRGRIFGHARRIDEGIVLSDAVRECALEHGWRRIAADALELRCVLEHYAGRIRGAADFARRALTLYQELDDREGIVRARLRLGDNCSYVGRHSEAVAHYRDALELAGTLELVGQQAWCHWGIGYCLYQALRPHDARGHLETARRLFKAAGQPRQEMSVLAGLADVDQQTGDFRRAIERHRRVYESLEAQKSSLLIPTLNVAMAYFFAGDRDDAARWARSAQQLAPPQDRGWSAVHALWLAIAADARDLDEWDTRIEQLRGLLDETGLVEIELALLVEHAATSAAEHRDRERARQAYLLASQLWTQLGLSERALAAKRHAKECCKSA